MASIQSPKQLVLKAKGLYSFPNIFSDVPDGALVNADNVVIDRDDIVESRRGWSVYGTFADVPTQILKITEYQDTLLAHANSNKLYYDSDDAGTMLPYSGTFVTPDPTDQGNRLHFEQANGNLYFITSNGLYKLDDVTSQPIQAGAAPGLGGQGSTTGTDGFLTNNANVAYRIVWGYTDANANFIAGAPSDRILVSNLTSGYQIVEFTAAKAGGDATGLANDATVYSCSIAVDGATATLVNITGSTAQTYTTLISQLNIDVAGLEITFDSGNLKIASASQLSGSAISIVDTDLFATLTDFDVIADAVQSTRNVSLTFFIPQTVTTTYVYQVYRGNQSATVNDPPDDEGQLVFQASPSAGDITAQFITITDVVPDSLRQTTIYTAESQQGILQANYQPPFTKDLSFYKGFMFFSNTATKQILNPTLVNVGSPTGIQVGDTVSFYRSPATLLFTLTAAAAENPATGAFLVTSSEDPATNIQMTAQSLVNIGNQFASNADLDCYYTTPFEGLPGAMSFVDRALTGTAFYMVCSRSGQVFSPPLPTSGSVSDNTSENDVKINRVYYSKYQQPEAVPLLNYIDVGSDDAPIHHMGRLKDSLFILKRDGTFKIFGTTPPFELVTLDLSTHIIAPESAVVLNNEFYFFSDQGVVNASESALSPTSRPIEKDLLTLSSPLYPFFPGATFGISYQSDRRYILGTVSNVTDETASQMFVYNVFTKTWCRWAFAFTCGVVRPSDNKLYFGTANPLGGKIYRERKDFTTGDFADEEFDVVITAVDGLIVTLADTSDVVAGQTLKQTNITNNVLSVVIESIDGNDLTMASAEAWDLDDAVVYNPISCFVLTAPLFGPDPTMMKQFTEASFVFQTTDFSSLEVEFRSDLTLTQVPQSINFEIGALAFGGWATFPWSSTVWGGLVTNNQRIRTYVPRTAQKCNWLQVGVSLSEAFQSFGLAGINLIYRPISTRMR